MNDNSSLQVDDQAAAAVAVAPRVTFAYIESNIRNIAFIQGESWSGVVGEPSDRLKVTTLCIVEFANGFVVFGKTAPASPENFDAELGRKFARDDALRQAWPLFGFLLCDRMMTDPGAELE